MATRVLRELVNVPRGDTELDALFARRGWLSRVPADFRTTVLGLGRPLQVRRGEYVYSLGDPTGGIYGVMSGGIGVEGCTPWHSPRLGHVFRAGFWFGWGPVLGGQARTMGMRALEDSELLSVSLPALKQLMEVDSRAGQLLGDGANFGADIASWVACDLLISDGARRITAVLLRVTGVLDGLPADQPRGFLLTQHDLGEMANASRHHVNRVLGMLSREGWIATSYNHIHLLDVAALKRFAFED